MLCLGQVDDFNAFGGELTRFWVAMGIVQYQKNFKRQFFTDKVLPDFRKKESIEPMQKRSSHPGFVVQPKE